MKDSSDNRADVSAEDARPTESEDSQRLSFIFTVLQRRYPHIVTIEDGLNRAACEREALNHARKRASDYIASNVADPDITGEMWRNYEMYQLAEKELKLFLSENVRGYNAAGVSDPKDSFSDEGKKAK